MKRLWSLCFLLFFVHRVSALEPFSISITQKDGLPSNSVYQIFQDQKGFMWFATDRGLVRYDGARFFKPQFPFEKSRAGSEIKQDIYGHIWYINFDGYVFYSEGKRFRDFPQNKPVGYFRYGIYKDYLFLVQEKGIDVFSIKTKKRIKHFPCNTLNFGMSGMTSNGFVFCVGKKNYCIDFKLKLIEHFMQDRPLSKMASNDGIDVFQLQEKKGSAYYCFERNKSVELAVPSQLFYQNISVSTSRIAFCTTEGVYCYQKSSRKFPRLLFKNENVSDLYIDREGNYWVSTIQNGVKFIPHADLRFQAVQAVPFALFQKNNATRMIDEYGVVYSVHHELKREIDLGNNKELGRLERFFPMLGTPYYGVQTKTFSLFDATGKKVIQKPIALKGVEIWDEHFAAVAISGVIGLLNYSQTTQKPKLAIGHNAFPSSDEDIIPFQMRLRGKCVAIDSAKQIIYYGTNKGLFQFKNGQLNELKWKGNSLYVIQMLAYKKSYLVLTEGGILFQLNRGRLSKIVSFHNKPLSPSLTRLKYSEHKLFFIGEHNIQVLESNGKLLDVDVSISPSEIIDLEYAHGRLFLALKDGIANVEFAKLLKSSSEKLIFERIDFVVNDRSLSYHNDLQLAYDKNDIRIDFALLNFRHHFPLHYQINNMHWKNAGEKSGSIFLTALQPGEYTIRFKLNGNVLKDKTMHFEITAPFWSRWEVIWSFFLGIVLFLFLLFRFRLRAIRKRNALEKAKIEIEKALKESMLKAVKAQMNPHFFYNALNTIQSFIYEDDKRNAATFLSKFSVLSRLILEMSEQSLISLEQEIKALQLYVEIEQARFGSDFQFEFYCEENLPIQQIKIPPMLIQPFVENAVKHGLLHRKGTKKLKIHFALDRMNVLKVSVEDNGVGREKAAKINENRPFHQSFSSGANEQRLLLLQREVTDLHLQYIDLKNSQQESMGTIVELYIPFDA